MRTSPVGNLLVVSCVAILVGCATPSMEEMSNADYGPYPTEYEQAVKNVMNQQLKDPDSAKYQFDVPRKGWYCNAAYRGQWGSKKVYGYIVAVQVNAKNSFGGYTGSEQYYFMIRDGRVLDLKIIPASFGRPQPIAGFVE